MRNLEKFTYIDLFAGIGGFHLAADALGGKCLFASEIDTEAKKAYHANYGLMPQGDITKISSDEIPSHDVLLAGFPCQPFSIIGNRLGFDDIRGTLFFEIVYEGMAWSVKSIKTPVPHSTQKIRVISGRCSPDYSYGITDPHEDVERTGAAVLSIWNERINIAKELYEPLRTNVLVRNFNNLSFLVFEQETTRYNTRDYTWRANKNGNLEGYERGTNQHKFTWQPHGSQFTILYNVPPSAQKFKIKRPPVLDFEETMAQIGFDKDWVTIL